MPELPEVEIIVQALRNGGRDGPSLPGRTIEIVQLLWDRSLAVPRPDELQTCLSGKTILDIGRRGKYIIFYFETLAMLIHLKMSGDLVVESTSDAPGKHHRLLVDFRDKTRLSFVDPRKFGRIWVTSDPDAVIGKLGPEPLAPDFDARTLYTSLLRYKRQLKPLLMDQSFLAGLGNIYTDEALHLAHLHPCQISDQVTKTQAQCLWQAIRQVLSEGIRRNGASIDWVYRGGNFQNHFRVYQRTGEPCNVCGAPIQRMIIGQRSTHYCPNCQIINGE